MTEPVNERPLFPPLVQSNAIGIAQWATSMIRQLTTVFQQYGYRLNKSIVDDGAVGMIAPLTLATYTVATLPTAADYEGAIIYVSDGAAGAKFRGSDGTSWVNLG